MIPIRKKGKFEQPRQFPAEPVFDKAAQPQPPVDPEAPTMVIPQIDAEDPASCPTVRLPEVPQAQTEVPPPVSDGPDAPEKKSKRSGKKLSVGMILGIIAGGLVLALILGMFIYGIVLKSGKTIYPNVYVAGIDVGGMERAEAIEAVSDAVRSSYASSTLTLELPDRTLEFTPDKTNVALDAEEAIDEALALGRSGDPFSAVTSFLSSRVREHYVDLQSALELDTGYIRSVLEEVAAEVESSPSPSIAQYDETAKELVIKVGHPERSLDVDGLYDAVYAAFMSSDFSPMQWGYDEEPTRHMDLQPYFDRYCTAMQDAYYDEETHTIVDSVPGYGFDMEKTLQKLEEAEPGSELVIPMADLEPAVTTQVLEQEMFGTELFATSTEYVVNANRTKNLTLACQAIDGIILNPGDVFSFNNVVGERTAAKGYMPATVYSGGLSLEELGGGVCQVASSIYYCTLHLDLEQVHREPHQYVVTYVPKGMDATVYWGHIDYQFRNTLDMPIRITANTDNGNVNIAFLGAEELDYSVKMETVTLETYPWREVEELDETKEPGYRQVDITPYTGYKVVTYKTILDAQGNEVSRDQEAVSVYSKRDQKVIVGPPLDETPDDPFDPDLWGPGTEDPGTEDPGTDDPGAEDPGTDDPGTDDPGTEDPGTEDPGTDDPGTDDPGTDDPIEDPFAGFGDSE
ncbi:MAG: VanW family protein [Oscillospiraceae bacterium]|nr:VanW family protein [Oscillospiraceae bacterium]